MTATLTGKSYFDVSLQKRRYEVLYACLAQDQYLDDTTFQCPGNALQPPTRVLTNEVALKRLFPDLTLRTGMVNTYTLWQTATIPAAQMRACDGFSHCVVVQSPVISQDVSGNQLMRSRGAFGRSSTFGLSAVSEAKPSAMVIAPTQGSYVAAESSGAGAGSISVTVAAESDAPLKEIAILLDGTPVSTVAFAQGEGLTQTQRTVAVVVGSEGLHTLDTRATDWAGTVQSNTNPISFTLDTQPPTATLDISTLTVSDTWQLESGVLRFRGTATDSVGLAAVQVKVDDLPFADAVFENGEWHTALPLADPEGKTLSVTVRAIDFAGQRTLFSQRVGTNLSSVDAPDTTIITGPANPSAVTSATVTFTGTSATDEVVAFDCQIDDGLYVPCVSPWPLVDLSNGDHVFRVRAIDSQGHVDLSPASVAWTIDVSTLKTTVTAGPVGDMITRTARFEFTGASGVTGFECALDGSVFTACVSPHSYTDLAYGPHTFRVRATAGAGNFGASTQVIWSVLNAAPIANSQSVTTTERKAVDVALIASDADTAADAVLFTVDSPAHGVLQGIPPNVTYTPDTDFVGTDRFTFRASDAVAASNMATVTIVVSDDDVGSPATTISLTSALSTVQNGWFVSPVHVVVSATDDTDPNATGLAETRCVLNPLTVPVTFADLTAGCAYLGAGADVSADGVYTVYAASRDIAGNTEIPISQTFRLDSTLDDDVLTPTTTISLSSISSILSIGQNNRFTSTVHVVVSATDVIDPYTAGVAETRCVLNPSTPPATFADLPASCAYLGGAGGGADVSAAGVYTVYAASRDNAGNIEMPVSQTFYLNDVVSPTSFISLTSATSTSQNELFTSTVHIVVSATDGMDLNATGVAETRCVLNPTASPATFADLPTGCAYLGSGTGGADVSADGIYTVYAASRDNAGNTEVPISRTFRLTLAVVDGSPPTSVISLTSAMAVGQNGEFVSPVHVVVSATDVSGVAETRCVLNPTASPATFADLPTGCAYLGSGTGGADVSADGIYTVYAASRDNAGNTEVPISRTFRLTLAVVDGSPPTSVISLTSAMAVGQNGEFVSHVVVRTSGVAERRIREPGACGRECNRRKWCGRCMWS